MSRALSCKNLADTIRASPMWTPVLMCPDGAVSTLLGLQHHSSFEPQGDVSNPSFGNQIKGEIGESMDMSGPTKKSGQAHAAASLSMDKEGKCKGYRWIARRNRGVPMCPQTFDDVRLRSSFGDALVLVELWGVLSVSEK